MVRVAAFLCALEQFVGTVESRTTHHRLGKQADKVFGSLYIECASNLETSGAHSANFMGKVSARGRHLTSKHTSLRDSKVISVAIFCHFMACSIVAHVAKKPFRQHNRIHAICPAATLSDYYPRQRVLIS